MPYQSMGRAHRRAVGADGELVLSVAHRRADALVTTLNVLTAAVEGDHVSILCPGDLCETWAPNHCAQQMSQRRFCRKHRFPSVEGQGEGRAWFLLPGMLVELV